MKRILFALALVALAVLSILASVRPAVALDAGETAPDFRLPSTFGSDISLSEYRGKKWVLLEFYAADFAPA